jgi:hypothetical protein
MGKEGLAMPEIATVYDKYLRDFDERPVRQRRAVTTTRLFDQQEFTPEVCQVWRPEYPLQYIVEGNETYIRLQLAGGMAECTYVPAKAESGVTYPLENISAPSVELEQEYEIYVKMPPKSVRKIRGKITRRTKGIPNPIL